MGFATKIIEIDGKVGKFHPDIIEYWEEVYNNVLLEYLYLNKLDFDVKIRCHVEDTPITHNHHIDSSVRTLPRVLIPIGGIMFR